MRRIAALLVLSAAPAFGQSATTSVAATRGGSTTTVTSGTAEAPATTTVTTTPRGTMVKTTAVDPQSKMVCQTMETLGSRLGGHKVCKTRAQWREDARDDRQALDRVQTQRSINGGG